MHTPMRFKYVHTSQKGQSEVLPFSEKELLDGLNTHTVHADELTLTSGEELEDRYLSLDEKNVYR